MLGFLSYREENKFVEWLLHVKGQFEFHPNDVAEKFTFLHRK